LNWKTQLSLYEILPHRRKKIRSAKCGVYREIERWMRDLSDGEFVIVEELEGRIKERFFTIKR
jgi:hypothetical protein